jgi:hypothetical protein
VLPLPLVCVRRSERHRSRGQCRCHRCFSASSVSSPLQLSSSSSSNSPHPLEPPSSCRNPLPPSLTTRVTASPRTPLMPASQVLRCSGERRPPPLCPMPPLRPPQALREHLTTGKPPYRRQQEHHHAALGARAAW